MGEAGAMEPIVRVRDGVQTEFNGSWHRGEDPHWIPSKRDLQTPGAIDRYVLDGWLPERPFIDKATPVTAFGSCFAVNITNYLVARGYNLFGKTLDLDAHIVRFGEGIVNTFAIRQQFEWGLGVRELPDRLWWGGEAFAPLDPQVRATTRDIFQRTEVFIITVGLSEIWFDRATGEALWRAVPRKQFDPQAHGFRLSTVAENRDNLLAVVGLIHALNPAAKVVFTLSPIPLMATFRPITCLTANAVSKAILRVALDEVMAAVDRERVFYFPAYEVVTQFWPDPFIHDNRHPKQRVVDAIMRAFHRHYCLPEAAVSPPASG